MYEFFRLYLFNAQTPFQKLIIFIFIVWTVTWKGIALWKASKNDHKYWFIVLLLVNLFAIPEIIYLIFFAKTKKSLRGHPTLRRDHLA